MACGEGKTGCRRPGLGHDTCALCRGRHDETAHALVLGAGRGQLFPRLADKAERPLDGVSPVVGQAERHVRGQPRHAEAALGIEREVEPVLHSPPLLVGVSRLRGPQGGSVGVLVGSGHDELAARHAAFGLPEHGDYARIDRRGVPIEHCPCVGAYLVIPALHRLLVEFERAVGLPVVGNAQFLAAHHVAGGVEQFDVEHPAEVRGPERGGVNDIGVEPDGLALDVGVIVEMQVDLFARPALFVARHLAEQVHQAVGRRGLGLRRAHRRPP